MFLGEYTHSIDDKGRLTIPARFRGELAAGLVATYGFDRNIMVYPISEWTKLAEKIASQPVSRESVRDLRRRVFSQAIDLSPDRQGRILVPPQLREFAGIGGEAVIVGVYNFVEIWSVESWKAKREAIDSESDGERWADLGI